MFIAAAPPLNLLLEGDPMSALILKRASASRRSGEWSDDDYDVLADGVVVGRIMKAAANRPTHPDAGLRAARGRRPDARLRGDTRGWPRSPSLC
jgi:hypothetical protein